MTFETPAVQDEVRPITVEQQKMHPDLHNYIATFAARYPTYAKDIRVNRAFVMREVAKVLPKLAGRKKESDEVLRQIEEGVQALPDAGIGAKILLRMAVIQEPFLLHSLPEPNETAGLTMFDKDDGARRRYVIPMFDELPSFDGVQITSGLMVLYQSVPPLVNQFADNRGLGYGGGPPNYSGARARDVYLSGDVGIGEDDWRLPPPASPSLTALPPAPVPMPMQGESVSETPKTTVTIGGVAMVGGVIAAAELAPRIEHEIAERREEERRLEMRREELHREELQRGEMHRQEMNREEERRRAASLSNPVAPAAIVADEVQTAAIIAAETEMPRPSSGVVPAPEVAGVERLAVATLAAEAEVTAVAAIETVLQQAPTRPTGVEVPVEPVASASVAATAENISGTTNAAAAPVAAVGAPTATESPVASAAASVVAPVAGETAPTAVSTPAPAPEPSPTTTAPEPAASGPIEVSGVETTSPQQVPANDYVVTGASGSIATTENQTQIVGQPTEEQQQQQEVTPQDMKHQLDELREKLGPENRAFGVDVREEEGYVAAVSDEKETSTSPSTATVVPVEGIHHYDALRAHEVSPLAAPFIAPKGKIPATKITPQQQARARNVRVTRGNALKKKLKTAKAKVGVKKATAKVQLSSETLDHLTPSI